MQRHSSDQHDVNPGLPRFLAIARDPRIVPGLHHACDEWCDHCPLTDRCLFFQCTREFRRQRRRPASAPAFRTAAEALQFARDLASIDEPPPGLGISAVTRGEHPLDPVSRNALAAFLPDDDSLAGLALEYSRRSRAFVQSAFAEATADRSDASIGNPVVPKPTPSEVILRFHSRIYFKTTRALVGYRLAASGMADRGADANTCAGQTLACVDRSREALVQFPDGDERRALAGLLDTIACGIEARFPDVRALLRRRRPPPTS
jgi:hypothetical protein